MASPNSTLPNDEKEAQDSAYNPGEQAYREGIGEGKHDSVPGYDRSADGLDDHPISGGDASGVDPQDSAAGVRNAEASGAGFYKPSPEGKKKKTGKKNFFVRRGGVVGLIATLLIGGGIAGTALLSPAGLFLSLGNTFTNAWDDSGPALSIRANAMFRLKVAGVGNAFEESSDGKCNIKCQFGTVSEQMKNNLESSSNDFHAEFSDKKFGGRYTIKSLTFPDGTTVTTKADFDKAMADPVRAASFNREFNNRIKFFVNGSKFASALKTKLGLDRLPKIVGDTKDKIIASIRGASGATGDTAAADGTGTVDSKKSTLASKISSKLKAPTEKAGKAGDIIAAVCLAYDTTQISVAATKALKIAAFAGFALAFLQVKDEIQDGTADPNVVATAGAQLTDSPNPPDSSSAFKQAQNGDNVPNTSKFTLSPSTGFAQVLAGIGGVIAVNAVARAAAHTTCASANNPAAPIIQCIPEIAGGLAEFGVGAVVNAVACIGTNVIVGATVGGIIGASLPLIIDTIAKSDLTIPDETTKGADATEVIGLGTKPIFNAKSQAYGLHPATSQADIENYQHATVGAVEQEQAVANLNSQSDPFNVNDPNTFVGSLVNKLNLGGYKNASIFSMIGNTFGLLPRSLSTISSTIYADSGYPLGYDKAKLYSIDNSPSLGAIGVVSSNDGEETYVMNQAELDMDPDAAIDTLVSDNDIDSDTGEAIAGSNFDKWTNYCGANRVDPMGETTGSIVDNDYEWEIGAQCTVDNPEMEAIHVYTMDSAINDTFDGTGSATPAATSSTTAVEPVDSGTQLNNDFSQADPGVSFAASVGKPVYAVMDGKVTAIDTSGNDTVSILHTNGTVSQYLYMNSNDISVHIGDNVKAGQQIGTVGSSGDVSATGSGLGFRVYIDGVDLTQQSTIANLADTSTNIIKVDDHTYISPTSYMALFGVALGS